jgi:heme A synthase
MRLHRFAAFAWGVVGFNLAVILWGAYVRASGSGAGCGAHWPLCNGEVMPREAQAKTLIELTHRLTSGLALLLVVGLAIWAFRAYRKGHRVRRGAALSVAFILTEALIGAGLVLFELVADNASMARAMFMSVHLINTFILLAVLTLTAWWASGGEAPSWRGQGALRWLFASALAGTLVLAVSGAVAALGDTLFPSNSLAAGLSADFSTASHLLIRLRLLHPLLAVAVGGLVLLTAQVASRRRPGPQVTRWRWVVSSLVLVQLGAGLLNVYLLAPIWLQLVHLLLADLMWLALVLLTVTALAARAEAREPASRTAASRPTTVTTAT